MNQSELEANTFSQRQTRENACKQVTIGFGLTSYWFEKVARDFFGQSQSVAMQLKTALLRNSPCILHRISHCKF